VGGSGLYKMGVYSGTEMRILQVDLGAAIEAMSWRKLAVWRRRTSLGCLRMARRRMSR